MIHSPRNRQSHALQAKRGRQFRKLLDDQTLPIVSHQLKAEQSNSSIIYRDTFFLKLYRRLDEGINPDVELSELLTEKTRFRHLSAYAGALEWHRPRKQTISIGMLSAWVPSENNAWNYSLDSVERYYHHAILQKEPFRRPAIPTSLMDVDPDAIGLEIRDLIGGVYLDNAALLGQRTAEMHTALASLNMNQDTAPEPFSLLYQKSLYQSIRNLALQVFRELADGSDNLDASLSKDVETMLDSQKEILDRVRRMTAKKIAARKIRIHGDLHLGQILHTGKDFVFIDFEGEPARTISERRLKYSPLRDVAGMIRSFHYAAYGCLLQRMVKQGVEPQPLYAWADLWYYTVAGVFLDAYRRTLQGSGILPEDEADFSMLLETFLLEKAVYELGYEFNNRPEWLMIPLRGIADLLTETE
jgi:maltose alpha-D-glucosyltransferase/alpha-amylase